MTTEPEMATHPRKGHHTMTQADALWCMHVTGMDDVHPAPDRTMAQLWAAQSTVANQRRNPAPDALDPVVNFTVAPWPWSAEQHAERLAQSIAENTWPVDPLATQPQPDAEALRELLKPFAEAADDLGDRHADKSDIWESPAAMSINAGHLRAVAAFLKDQPHD